MNGYSRYRAKGGPNSIFHENHVCFIEVLKAGKQLQLWIQRKTKVLSFDFNINDNLQVGLHDNRNRHVNDKS